MDFPIPFWISGKVLQGRKGSSSPPEGAALTQQFNGSQTTISHFISMYFQVKHNPQIDESKLLLEGLKKEILTSQEINK